jgi:hypothetical protein
LHAIACRRALDKRDNRKHGSKRDFDDLNWQTQLSLEEEVLDKLESTHTKQFYSEEVWTIKQTQQNTTAHRRGVQTNQHMYFSNRDIHRIGFDNLSKHNCPQKRLWDIKKKLCCANTLYTCSNFPLTLVRVGAYWI